MTARGLARRASSSWERFFYGMGDVDARVLALLRAGFAALVLAHVFALFPHVGMLWSDAGVLPLEHLPAVAGGPAPTLLSAVAGWGIAPSLGFALLGAHAALLGIGFRTRLQLVLVLVWLVSFQNRNPLVTNGQDVLLRICAVLLALLPLGGAWSLDARRHGSTEPSPEKLWPLRLLQIQVSFVMLAAALWKVQGTDWTDGTALHYVTRLRGFWGNGPVPAAFLESPSLLALATRLTLALELALPFAVWVPRLRLPALFAAIGFHLSLAYAMNLFLFPWVMILGWCSFLRASDVERLTRAIASRPRRRGRLDQLTVQRSRP